VSRSSRTRLHGGAAIAAGAAAAMALAAPAFAAQEPAAAAPAVSAATAAPPPAAATDAHANATARPMQPPVAQDLLVVHLPHPRRFQLPGGPGGRGGARVLVVEDHSLPLITITVSVRAGSLFDPTSRPGVADLTADLLNEGTERRSHEEISEQTERIGASIYGAAGDERAVVTATGISDDVDTIVDILADVLLHPTFPADRLERARFRSIAALQQQASSPQFLATQQTRALLYGVDSAYGRPPATPDQIKSITPDDLKDFYHRHYRNTPQTLIGVTGDVHVDEIYRKLSAALAGWPAGGDAAVADDDPLPAANFAPRTATAVTIVDRPGSSQTVLSFANVAITRTDPDYFPLLVANYLLGGDSSARLFLSLRERKGYTYGAYSSVSTAHYPGIWSASANVRNSVTGPAAAAFLDEFQRLQEQPVPDSELSAVQRALVGRFALTLENPTVVLSRLLDVADYGLPDDYWDAYPKNIQAVTITDIQRVARKYLGASGFQLIAVGESKEIAPALAAYGPVTVVTADQVLSGSAR
jgi:zinc protease